MKMNRPKNERPDAIQAPDSEARVKLAGGGGGEEEGESGSGGKSGMRIGASGNGLRIATGQGQSAGGETSDQHDGDGPGAVMGTSSGKGYFKLLYLECRDIPKLDLCLDALVSSLEEGLKNQGKKEESGAEG